VGNKKMFRWYKNFNLTKFIEQLNDRPLQFGFNNIPPEGSSAEDALIFQKTFTAYVRNLTIDGKPYQIADGGFVGGAKISDCPKDIKFTDNKSSVLLKENYAIDDKFRAYFEVKTSENKLNCSALLLSASDGKAQLTIEIVDGSLFLFMNNSEGKSSLNPFYFDFLKQDNNVCDGNWHSVGVTKHGKNVKIIYGKFKA